MKICEITKFNKDMSSTLTGRHTLDMDKILQDKGWKFLNQGHFSATYLSPNEKSVLKINRAADPGYEHFIKVVKKFPNIHFPVISDKKKLPDGTSAYIMERLYVMEWNDEQLVGIIQDAMAYIMTNELKEYERLYPNDIKALKMQPGLIEALEILAKFRGSFKNDIRHDNMMKRKDGTIVIIDPYGPRRFD